MAKFGTKLTVRDLIEALQKMPPDAEVIGFDIDRSTTCTVDCVDINFLNGEYTEAPPQAGMSVEAWAEEHGWELAEAQFMLNKERVCVIHIDTGYSFSDNDYFASEEEGESDDETDSGC